MARTWITKVNNVDTVDAAHVNDLQTYKLDKDELPYVRPEDYGAVGDGVTDDTAAIQAAIDSIPDTATGAGPRMVLFDGGKYAMTSVTLPDFGRCVIDGNGSQIFPIGNPAYVFKMLGAAASPNHYTTIKNFECWDSCTDFVYFEGGNFYFFNIENIVHREGILSAVVHLKNTSLVTAPGLWTIRGIRSSPWNTATDYASYALRFEVPTDDAGYQGWDTGIIEDIIIGTSVAGGRAIYVTPGEAVYLRHTSINKVFLGAYGAGATNGYAIQGWFINCKISNVYFESNSNGIVLSGYFTRCDLSNFGIYTDDADAVGVRAASITAVQCDISQFWAEVGTAQPYLTGVYKIFEASEGSTYNRLYWPRELYGNAIALFGAAATAVETFGMIIPSHSVDVTLGFSPTTGSYGKLKAVYGDGDPAAIGEAATIDFWRPVAYTGNEGEIRFNTNPGGAGVGSLTKRMTIDRQGNVCIGVDAIAEDYYARGALVQGTNYAPATGPADAYEQYSADAGGVAGQAGPHFRTEAGGVIGMRAALGTMLQYTYQKDDLADDGTVTLPDATSGMVLVSCNGEAGMWLVQADGTVTKISGSTNTAAADTDANLCVYDGGTGAIVKNRLGATGEIRIIYYYN